MTTELTPAMRRSILIATLRDKTLWPDGFEWNYARHDTCAIGLSERLFQREFKVRWRNPCHELGLSADQNTYLFNGWGFQGQASVTPEMVADRLEEMHRSLA